MLVPVMAIYYGACRLTRIGKAGSRVSNVPLALRNGKSLATCKLVTLGVMFKRLC